MTELKLVLMLSLIFESYSMTQAQTTARMTDSSGEIFLYNLDGFKTPDALDCARFGIRLDEVISNDTIQGTDSLRTVVFVLNKPIALDGIILTTPDEKKTKLGAIRRDQIQHITFFRSRDFYKKYRIKTKTGGVVIETKK